MPHVTGTSWPKSVMSHHVQICDAGASELTPNTRPSRKGRGEALWWCKERSFRRPTGNFGKLRLNLDVDLG